MWKYLNRHPKVKRLSSDLVSEFDWSNVDEETRLIIMSGAAKDARGARKLLDKHGVQTAAELLKVLPPRRRRPSVRARFVTWLLRLLGETDYDKTRTVLREKTSRARGFTYVKMRRILKGHELWGRW